ncbi:MAG: tetratricopeptide repeat protein, partial [Geobacteraceae bacterium]|nr:tetratricopeptide repeat protein [Geobacteraceae bacterium]
MNLGYVLGEQGRSQEAFQCYDAVLAEFPDCAEARYNRAAHLLRAGDYITGFAEYEARFTAMQNVDQRAYPQPRWDGSPLNGRSILVYAEQGLGDAIQFSRYIPFLAALGARVVLEVQPSLVSLLASIKGLERVVVKSDIPPATDVHIPLLSLPHLFATTLATIPADVPYLVPPRHLIEQWRTRLANGPSGQRIGLAWAGKQTPYPNRSCPPEYLAPLFDLDGIRHYSLQLGEQDRLPLPTELAAKVIDLTDGIKDFADTAALIANLDLVITIDTAVAHLAGALGRPVWVLLPHAADWRWLEGRDDSPWYPTMRLFRQPQPGAWSAVINEVALALCESVAPGVEMVEESDESPESLFQTAMRLLEQEEATPAIARFRKLAEALPDEPAVWFNLGRAYLLDAQQSDAERCFLEVLRLKPRSPDAWLRLGQLYRERRDFAEAETYLRQAHLLVPDSVDIMLELGTTLIPQGKRGEALELCRKILAVRPDCKEAISNLAHLQLSSGDYLHGFENFEVRLEIEKFQIDPRAYPQPRWDGTPLEGKSILVYGEQGMGDVIMFSRYFPLIVERGGRIVLEVDRLLIPLFTGFPGVAQVVEKSAVPPVTDVYIQSSSLPYLFRTTADTIPARVPYLTVDPAKEAAWRGLLAKDATLRVGLVWRGQPLNPLDRDRSASLEAFAPLAEVSGVSYYSLQVGPAAQEAQSPPAGMRLTDYTDRLEDFSDTAALIANLDLIIGIDTGVVHLAGALAKPVWVVLPYVAEWRWLMDREDSPWYPTMRLFRQERPGEWGGVLKRVAEALAALVDEQGNSGQATGAVESSYAAGARLLEQGDLAGAEHCFRRIVRQAPDLPDPHHSLGVVLQLEERLPEAIEQYRSAIARDPGFVKAHYNLATALWHYGTYQEAITALTTALALDPGHADAHRLLGALFLLTGDYRRGWEEYEWRWEARGCTTKRQNFSQPQWDGSPLDNRTLLIHMEQGRGDMIQFIRYAPLVAASGGRVVVCAVRELVDLLTTVRGVSQVVDREGVLPPFDVHIPAVSLPRLFKTDLETVPRQVPYLWPDQAKVAAWRQLIPTNGRFRIGLVWAGQEKPDPGRSLPLQLCLPLVALDRVDIYSLQIGRGVDELSSLPAGCVLTDLTDRIADFADTAALIANLDLVISVDTAVAHLAGALGRPVWTLLPYVPDWRWLLERNDTPWYPTMRLFRQRAPGDWEDVVVQLQKELAELLGQADFHRQRGISLLQAGRAVEAESAFDWAIELNPQDAEAYSDRGAALASQERYREALASYGAALALRPDFVQAVFNMGNSYRNLGEPAAASRCYAQALELSPGLVPAALCLAELCKEAGDFGRAEGYLEQALAVAPDAIDVLVSRGEVFQSQERFPEALEAYKRALAVDPDNVKVVNKIGTTLHLAGRLEEAEEYFRKGLARDPDMVAILNNLGAVYQSWGRFVDSLPLLRRVVVVDPAYADGHWNLALSLLACGEYEEGWQEYEWRFKKTNPVPERHYPQPRWDGSLLHGRNILLHAEQGLGDTLQFIRYATMVARLGGRVTVECQSGSLKRLIESVAGVSCVVVAGDPLPLFDCHAPLMSLPLLFHTTVATIPAESPYLAATEADVGLWNARIAQTDSLKVGLVWAGRQNQLLNRGRTCNLDTFAPLAAVPGVTFYSLQLGEGAVQAATPPTGLNLVDLTGHIRDFADTAALIANLDLVITIDTSVAHLAGALGKP